MDATNGFEYPGAGPATVISVPETPEGYTLTRQDGPRWGRTGGGPQTLIRLYHLDVEVGHIIVADRNYYIAYSHIDLSRRGTGLGKLLYRCAAYVMGGLLQGDPHSHGGAHLRASLAHDPNWVIRDGVWMIYRPAARAR